MQMHARDATPAPGGTRSAVARRMAIKLLAAEREQRFVVGVLKRVRRCLPYLRSDIWGHWLIPSLVCHPTVGAGAPGRSGIAAPGLPLHDASQPIALTAGVTSAVERGGNAAHISDTVVIVRSRRSHRKLIGGAEGRSAPGSTCLPWSPGGSVREVFCCRDVCVVCNPLYRATVVNLAKIADAFTA
jgi:hypothetical protein